LNNITDSALYASAAPVGKDYLSCLPTELLLKVFAYLPIRCFLDLVHTSTSFKHFLQTNPARICNNAIQLTYAVNLSLCDRNWNLNGLSRL
jgi:hypothetical protein